MIKVITEPLPALLFFLVQYFGSYRALFLIIEITHPGERSFINHGGSLLGCNCLLTSVVPPWRLYLRAIHDMTSRRPSLIERHGADSGIDFPDQLPHKPPRVRPKDWPQSR